MFIAAGGLIAGGSNTQIFDFPTDLLAGFLLGAGIRAAAGSLVLLVTRSIRKS